MRNVAEILMKRDSISAEEAKYLIDSCIQAMEEVGYEPAECEEILMDHLGLEPDYLIDLLY